MAMGMLQGVIKQMVNKFQGKSADDLITQMQKQPEAVQLFGMLKQVGVSEDQLKKMINDEITNSKKKKS